MPKRVLICLVLALPLALTLPEIAAAETPVQIAPEITWKKFKGVGPFKIEMQTRVTREHLEKMASSLIDWDDYSGVLWDKADTLRNENQSAFQESLSSYMRLMLAGKDLEKNHATYSALSNSLKSLKESRKALQKSFLQNLREIDFPILIKNTGVFDAYKDSNPAAFSRKLEADMDKFVNEENIQNQVVGSWLETEATVVDGRITEDIKVNKRGFRLEQFPSDPIVYISSIPGTPQKKQYVVYKALRIYPNFTFENESLYAIASSERSTCSGCEVVAVNFAPGRGVNTPLDKQMIDLRDDIRRHATIQNERLEKVIEAHNVQMADMNKQITTYNSQMTAIRAEVEKTAKQVLPAEDLQQAPFRNWDKYDQVFAYLGGKLALEQGQAEDKLNSLFNTSDKIVYTMQRVMIPDQTDFREFFWNRMNPNQSGSDFNLLMDRIKELRRIEVTTVKNGVPTSIKGTEFYVDPTLNSVREYAVIGPVMLVGDDNVSRALTYLLALKAELKKMTCPAGDKKGGVFKKSRYNAALTTCTPCQLPSIDELIRNSNLSNGEYWSRDSEDAAIKVYVKGRDRCDYYENNPLLTDNFTRFDAGTGVILKSKSSRSLYMCIDGAR